MNIVEQIRRETQPHADRTAIVEGERTITYRQLLDRAAALRDVLRARGVAADQRIAFRSHDGIDYVIGALALLECPAAVVPLADSLTPAEAQETIDRIDVHGVLTHADLPPAGPAGPGEKIADPFLWSPRHAAGRMDAPCAAIHPAFIRFSSGTTGASKGVVLSHRTILDRTDAANQGLGITHQDVILWVLGMSHHFVVSILLFLRQGATIIVANRNFPFSVLDAASRHPVTFIYGSPVHYFLLASADSVAPAALARVRLAVSTAMKMPAEVSTQFTQKFGFRPAEAYGIIEVGLPFINTENAPPDTLGRPLPAYQLRIVNPDPHGVGEVELKGKGMFDAYFSPWRTRADCLADGWFHTGDLGRVDPQARLTLLGRSKTVIVCAGMKVFPEEVEEVIDAFPGVAASLVSPRPHPHFGQVPTAHVIPRPGADESQLLPDLRAHCCARLSSYKVPVEFHLVPSLPRTPSGKLARTNLSW